MLCVPVVLGKVFQDRKARAVSALIKNFCPEAESCGESACVYLDVFVDFAMITVINHLKRVVPCLYARALFV